MAEANASLQQIPTLRITTAAHALAMLRSRNAVKDSLRAQGLKPAHYSAREITSWAMLYLDEHSAELIPAAMREAERMILSGAMGKRAQRALCATLITNAQSENEPISTTSALQISGAK
jgi:hypothetical protein